MDNLTTIILSIIGIFTAIFSSQKKGDDKMSNKVYDILNKIQRWLPALVFLKAYHG